MKNNVVCPDDCIFQSWQSPKPHCEDITTTAPINMCIQTTVPCQKTHQTVYMGENSDCKSQGRRRVRGLG